MLYLFVIVDSTLDADIKYIEEEIEIQIESIKIKLDQLFEKDSERFSFGFSSRDQLFDDMNQSKTEERFYEHQEKFERSTLYHFLVLTR